MNINEGVLRTINNPCERNPRTVQNNKRFNNVVTIQVGKRSKQNAPKIKVGNAFTSSTSSTNSTNWKNCPNLTIDLNTSSNRSYNYSIGDSDSKVIMAITEGRGEATCEVGLAAINVRHPELILCQISDIQSYTKIITKINVLNPVEIIVPLTMAKSRIVEKIKNKFTEMKITGVPRTTFNKESGMQFIKNLCAPKWNSVILMLQHRYYALTSAGALLTYLQNNHHIYYAKQSIKVEYQESEDYCVIDIFTADKLELVACALNNVNEKYSSLFGVINHCQTKIGTRMLRATILQPPCSVAEIEARLDCVEELKAQPDKIVSLQGILKQLSYIDQLLGLGLIMPDRTQNCTSRQLNYVLMLNSLFDSLEPLSEILDDLVHPTFTEIKCTLTNEGFIYLKEWIRMIVHENARPAKGQEGVTERCFAIKEGVNEILDIIRKTYSKRLNEMQEYVKSLGEKYQLNLKLSNNNKKGYHIVMQLSAQQRKSFKKSSLPEEFIQIERMTTMVTMKTIKILAYSNRLDDLMFDILKISNIILFGFLTKVRERIEIFYKLCEDVAKLDMLQSLADVCSSNRTYIRPEFGDILEVIDSRHPMLNFLCDKEPTCNDIHASKWYNVNIITGPNGSGKSIYIRQVVLLQVMAQIGCFVPATSAKFRVADRILARIYLEDNINCGASTFVLEMQEIKYFLNVMTSNTLIIIDELCRSTSVEEGAALAMAVCEHFLSTPAFVFFSTHYTLVTKLQQLSLNIRCWQLEALEHENSEFLKFTHKVLSGVTSLTGYAIGLAKACWPPDIIAYLKNILQVIKENEKSYEITHGIDPRLCLKYDLESELKLLKYKKQLTEDIVTAKLDRYSEDLQNCSGHFNSYIYPEVVYSFSRTESSESLNGVPRKKSKIFASNKSPCVGIAQNCINNSKTMQQSKHLAINESLRLSEGVVQEVMFQNVCEEPQLSPTSNQSIFEQFCEANPKTSNHMFENNQEPYDMHKEQVFGQYEIMEILEPPRHQKCSPQIITNNEFDQVEFDNLRQCENFKSSFPNNQVEIHIEIENDNISQKIKDIENIVEKNILNEFTLPLEYERLNNSRDIIYQSNNNNFQNTIFESNKLPEKNLPFENTSSIGNHRDCFKKPEFYKTSMVQSTKKLLPNKESSTSAFGGNKNHLLNVSKESSEIRFDLHLLKNAEKTSTPIGKKISLNSPQKIANVASDEVEPKTFDESKILSECQFSIPLLRNREKTSTPFLVNNSIPNKTIDKNSLKNICFQEEEASQTNVDLEERIHTDIEECSTHFEDEDFDEMIETLNAIHESSKYSLYKNRGNNEQLTNAGENKETNEVPKEISKSLVIKSLEGDDEIITDTCKCHQHNCCLKAQNENISISKHERNRNLNEPLENSKKQKYVERNNNLENNQVEPNIFKQSLKTNDKNLPDKGKDMIIDEDGRDISTQENLAKEIEECSKYFQDEDFDEDINGKNIQSIVEDCSKHFNKDMDQDQSSSEILNDEKISQVGNIQFKHNNENVAKKHNLTPEHFNFKINEGELNTKIFETKVVSSNDPISQVDNNDVNELFPKNIDFTKLSENVIFTTKKQDEENYESNDDLKESSQENILDASGSTSINYSPDYKLLARKTNIFSMKNVYEEPHLNKSENQIPTGKILRNSPENLNSIKANYSSGTKRIISEFSGPEFRLHRSIETINDKSTENTSEIIENNQITVEMSTSFITPNKANGSAKITELPGLEFRTSTSSKTSEKSKENRGEINENHQVTVETTNTSSITPNKAKGSPNITELSGIEFRTSTSTKTSDKSKGSTSGIIENHHVSLETVNTSIVTPNKANESSKIDEFRTSLSNKTCDKSKNTSEIIESHQLTPETTNTSSIPRSKVNVYPEISEFRRSTCSKMNDKSKENVGGIIEKQRKTMETNTITTNTNKPGNIFETFDLNFSFDLDISPKEITTNPSNFKPPIRSISSNPTSSELRLKDYNKTFLERDIENLHLTGEKCEAYVKEMLNRPSPRQIRGMRAIATAHKTKEGSIAIEHKQERKKFRRKKFKPPLKNFETAKTFDATIFSDEKVDIYNQFIKSDCGVGSENFNKVDRKSSSSDYQFFNAFSSSSSDNNVCNSSNNKSSTLSCFINNSENEVDALINKYLSK